ncbi:MAG: amidohydrolase [Anaerolineales bacterium]|nr:amidohydrolase [Anaerolineales bacterium]
MSLTTLTHARIYTLNPTQPVADAIAIQDGRVVAVGSEADIISATGEGKRLDLNGYTIIPGLTDSHIHLQHYSLSLLKVDCETSTRQDCLQRVAERTRKTLPGEWILGHGWNQNNWDEGFGTAADLDQIAPTNPVYLTAKSLHAAWVNSPALHLAGITSTTPDPAGGQIGRDATGNPNGILFESAMDLVSRIIPEPDIETIVQAIQNALPRLWGMGLTGAHDFDHSTCFTALQILRQRNQLRLRVVKSIPLEDLPYAIALGIRSGFGDDWLRIGSVKCFADGALGPCTAAMLEPYEGSVDQRGMLMLDADTLVEHGLMAVENGLSLAVHAIGDRANHEVLNAFSRLREHENDLAMRTTRGNSKPLRHRIEHVQLIHAKDAHRLAALNIIASMQPIHAPSDMLMADRYWGSRARLAYAWREQLRHGARLALGSDAPVESPNPFWGLHAAITRRRLDGSPGPDGWYAEQRLTLAEALHGFTSGAAFAAGMEDRLGCLAPGFLADLLVLEQDPFACQAHEIANIHPLATMVGGEWVYGDLN